VIELCARLIPFICALPFVLWAQPAALLGLLLLTLFGLGPSAVASLRPSLSKQFFDRRTFSQSWFETLSYSVTSAFFFVLFCLAAYMSSETRALGERMAVLDWPLWLIQSSLVLAFGCNVVRYSIYAADASARPAVSSSVERLHRSASSLESLDAANSGD